MANTQYTAQELEARAEDRAKTEKLHTWKIAGRPLYHVKSRTVEPGAFNVVTVSAKGDEAIHCSCIGFKHYGTCIHAKAVDRRLRRESKTTLSAEKRAQQERDTMAVAQPSVGRNDIFRAF